MRIGVSAGLLALIIYLVDVAAIERAIADVDLLAVVVATLIFLPTFLLVTPRWSIILGKLGYPLSIRRLYGPVLAGAFLNQVLPTAVGGDVYRGWRIARMGIPLGRVVTSVLIDRIFAFAAVIALLLLGILASFVEGLPIPAPVVVLAALGVAMVAGFALAGPILDSLGRFAPQRLKNAVSELSTMFRRCLSGDAAVPILVLSILNQLLILASILVLGRGLGIAIPLASTVVAVSASLILTTIPISFAGWGVREGAFAGVFAFYGVPIAQGVVLSVLLGLVLIVATLPGLFVLLWPSGRPADLAPTQDA